MAITKVWIEEGCIVCSGTEQEVFVTQSVESQLQTINNQIESYKKDILDDQISLTQLKQRKQELENILHSKD